jgi:hypothetical protein
MSDDTTTPAASDAAPEPEGERATADWAGVGEAFRSLGRHLSGHAQQAGDAVSSATGNAEGAVDQVKAGFTAAVDHIDATSTDPAVGKAARDATARLLDAIKAELTGEPRTGGADSGAAGSDA